MNKKTGSKIPAPTGPINLHKEIAMGKGMQAVTPKKQSKKTK